MIQHTKEGQKMHVPFPQKNLFLNVLSLALLGTATKNHTMVKAS